LNDEGDWWVEKDRQDLLDRLDYLAGLIARLGGGKRRAVYHALHRQLGGRRDDADHDQLYDATRYAEEWVERLRAADAGQAPQSRPFA
jgi:hypothetical protein